MQLELELGGRNPNLKHNVASRCLSVFDDVFGFLSAPGRLGSSMGGSESKAAGGGGMVPPSPRLQEIRNALAQVQAKYRHVNAFRTALNDPAKPFDADAVGGLRAILAECEAVVNAHKNDQYMNILEGPMWQKRQSASISTQPPSAVPPLRKNFVY